MSTTKNIILVGVTGSGKSTTGNCLFEQMPDMNKILHGPFVTDSGASGCTQLFNIQESKKHNLKIIDTVGFCDPNINAETCLADLRKSMNEINNTIHLIIYVFKKDRLTDNDVKFFELVQNDIFNNIEKTNSLLLVTHCPKGWVEKQKKNVFLSKAIENCGGRYLEFDLRFDQEDEPVEFFEHNRKEREKSINELCSCVREFFAESDKIAEKIKELQMKLRELEESKKNKK